MNKYFCSFASGDLQFSTNSDSFIINGTVGKCNLIKGDTCYIVTVTGRMFCDKLIDVQIDEAQLVFEKCGIHPVKSLTFIGRDDD